MLESMASADSRKDVNLDLQRESTRIIDCVLWQVAGDSSEHPRDGLQAQVWGARFDGPIGWALTL